MFLIVAIMLLIKIILADSSLINNHTTDGQILSNTKYLTHIIVDDDKGVFKKFN